MENRYDPTSPRQKHATANAPANTTTERKRLNTRIADSAGKMTSDEISIAPIMRMPSTTVSAVSSESSVLYVPTLTPVARENPSSNVTANSWW